VWAGVGCSALHLPGRPVCTTGAAAAAQQTAVTPPPRHPKTVAGRRGGAHQSRVPQRVTRPAVRPACRKLVGFPPPRLAAQLAPSLFSSAWLTLLSCLVHTWREYRPRHSQFLEQLSPPLLCDRPDWSGILLLILRLGFFCSQFNFPGTLHE